jgi:hypothetical protein
VEEEIFWVGRGSERGLTQLAGMQGIDWVGVWWWSARQAPSRTLNRTENMPLGGGSDESLSPSLPLRPKTAVHKKAAGGFLESAVSAAARRHQMKGRV